jgi:hypothetical protein
MHMLPSSHIYLCAEHMFLREASKHCPIWACWMSISIQCKNKSNYIYIITQHDHKIQTWTQTCSYRNLQWILKLVFLCETQSILHMEIKLSHSQGNSEIQWSGDTALSKRIAWDVTIFAPILTIQINPCGGGVEYLHRDPASRKRRRNGAKKGRAIA